MTTGIFSRISSFFSGSPDSVKVVHAEEAIPTPAVAVTVGQTAMSVENDSEDKFFDCRGTEEDVDMSEYEIVDPGECKEFFDCQQEFPTPSQSKIVSYIIRPSLYTMKYGAYTLSAATLGLSYASGGASCVVAGASYVPHWMSQALEVCKGEDKDTVGFKVVTAYQNSLKFTSGVTYAVSYLPHVASAAFGGVSNVAGKVGTFLSPEKIEEICAKSDSSIKKVSRRLGEVFDVSNVATALMVS